MIAKDITIDFRPAMASEAGRLSSLALRSKALWGYDEAFMEACVEELTVTPEIIATREVWVAETSGDTKAVIGFYTLCVPETPSDLAELSLFFAEPAAKGTGVGRAMWEHVEGRVRALGLAGVAFDADPFAQGFYEYMGAREVGRSPSGSIPGRTLARMEKHLIGQKPDQRAHD